MDVQTLLIGLGVFIISALLIWLITSLTVRERPFEERLAQQRQMEKELLFLDSKQVAHGSGLKKEKTKKKLGKKTKALGEQDANGLYPAEKVVKGNKVKNTKLLELEIDPTVIETALDEPPEMIVKGRTSKSAITPTVAGKPILANKGEKVAVRMEDHAPKLVHHRAVPKDDVELKHDREKFKSSHSTLNKDNNETKNTSDQSAPAKSVPEKVKEKVQPFPVVIAEPAEVTITSSAVNGNSSGAKLKKQKVQHEEIKADIMVKTQIEQIGTVAPAPSTADQSSRKKNKAASTESTIPVSVDGIIASLHKGPLSADETEHLIEILTAKKLAFAENVSLTQESTKKSQKDPVNAIAQQLQEKRREIEEEKLRNAIASQKVNELELELSEQRQKMAALVKQNYELNSQRQENAAMAGHIKQLESAAVTMRNQYDNLKAQWTTSHNELQRITTENHHLAAQNKRFNESETSMEELRTKVKIMEDALHSNSIQYNACENAKKSFESKVKHLEDQVSFLEKSLRDSQLLAKHYSEAPDELRKAELRIKSLNMELERLNSAMQHLEKDLALKQDETKLGENKLHDISRQKAELEGRLRLADTQTAELINTLKHRDAEVQALKAQLNDVALELKVVQDRPVLSSEETFTKSDAPVTSAPLSANIANLLENGTSAEHERLLQQELEECRDKLKAEIAALDQLHELEKVCDKLTSEIEVLKQDNKVLETSKKECDTLNKTLNEKVVELEQERLKVESSLNEKLRELADIQTKLSQKEWEFKEFEARLTDKEVELSNALSRVVQNANDSADISLAVTQKDAVIADLENRLQQKKTDHSNLLHQLETENSGLKATLLSKETELAEVQDRLRHLEADFSETRERIRQKDADNGGVDVSHVRSQLELKSAELDEHRSRLLVIETNASSLESTLREKEFQLAELNSRVISITEERSDLQARLLTTQAIIESLQKTQTDSSSSVKDDIDQYAKQVQCLQSNLESLQCENSTLKVTIQRMQSDLQKATQSVENEKYMQETEQAALLRQQVSDELQLELDRAKESENVLLLQIQHYKEVLSDTESILKRLQETVELEEQKNLQKLLLLESDLRSTKDEVSRLREDMKGMHRTSECFMGATSPAVDHSECMIRKDLSPVNKRLSLTELTGQNDAV